MNQSDGSSLFYIILLLGFLCLPQNKVKYSLMEGINNIIIGIWIEYECMHEYNCKSTTSIGITTRWEWNEMGWLW
jgi:hypothetical protein